MWIMFMLTALAANKVITLKNTMYCNYFKTLHTQILQIHA